MLINKLLLPVGVQYDGKIIKAPYDAPELEAVHQEYRDRELVPPGLIEKNVL
jgi:hypothetical protein